MSIAKSLSLVDMGDFDTELCLPGLTAMAMACSLVTLVRNDVKKSLQCVAEVELFSVAILPCVMDERDRHRFSSDGWGSLTPWLHPAPERFLSQAWIPFRSAKKKLSPLELTQKASQMVHK